MIIKKDRVTIICEMAQTYEGSFEVAEKLVDMAIAAGADAVKFQIFKADELATPDYQYYKLYQKLELNSEQWGKLIDQAHEGGVLALADVFGVDSARMLIRQGIDGFRIHTTDIKNLSFLKFLAQFGKSLLLSTSGSYKEEIEKALRILNENGAKEIVLMHGLQSYPTLVEDTDLYKIKLFKETFGVPVGFADHIDGGHKLNLDLCFLALGMGASVLEKHMTLDRALKMEDYESALDPSVFTEFVSKVRELEKALGSESFGFSMAEEKYRLGTKKHVVAAHGIDSGAKIVAEDLTMKRTAETYFFYEMEEAVGKTLISAVKKDEVIRLENLE